MRGAEWDSTALQMTGLEIMRAQLERRLPEPAITVLTGLRVSDVSLGENHVRHAGQSLVANRGWRLLGGDAGFRC
ncbi:MAG TPA: hypothetical protein VN961_08170 [Streptosporangiaceae bacterium]|nr:hypothetical protein [Streptosporangiaceae bacterium]